MAVITGTVAAAASIGGSVLQGRSQRKAQERQRNQQLTSIQAATDLRRRLQDEAVGGNFQGRFGLQDIFGSRRDEISLDDAILNSLQTNERNRGNIRRVTSGINEDISQEALDRAIRFDPNFTSNLTSLSDASRALLRGEIPTDIRDQVFRNAASQNSIVGVPGTAGSITARDLGLTSLDLQGRGASFFQQVNSTRDQIDPLSRHIQSRQFIADPSVQLQLEQANNAIRNGADPAAQALFGLELQGGREEAFAQSGVTVPVNNTFGNVLSAVGSGLGAFGGGGNFGGFGRSPQQQIVPQQPFGLPVSQFGK